MLIEAIIPSSFKDGEIVSMVINREFNWQGIVEELQKDGTFLYKIYFEDIKENHDKLEASLLELEDYGIFLPQENVTLKSLEDNNWAENWKQFFVPLKIGNNIVIKPSWREFNGNGSEIIIEIDPGMAFGVGSHETTRMAVALLEKYAPLTSSILDLGCGTGILAIVARRFGVSEVYAIDNDILAMSAIEENLALNNLSGSVDFRHLEGLKDFHHKVSMIVANIQASVFREIRKDFYPVLNDSGYLILTGILFEQRDEMVSIFSEEGFSLVEELKDGEWVSFVFKKI